MMSDVLQSDNNNKKGSPLRVSLSNFSIKRASLKKSLTSPTPGRKDSNIVPSDSSLPSGDTIVVVEDDASTPRAKSTPRAYKRSNTFDPSKNNQLDSRPGIRCSNSSDSFMKSHQSLAAAATTTATRKEEEAGVTPNNSGGELSISFSSSSSSNSGLKKTKNILIVPVVSSSSSSSCSSPLQKILDSPSSVESSPRSSSKRMKRGKATTISPSSSCGNILLPPKNKDAYTTYKDGILNFRKPEYNKDNHDTQYCFVCDHYAIYKNMNRFIASTLTDPNYLSVPLCTIYREVNLCNTCSITLGTTASLSSRALSFFMPL